MTPRCSSLFKFWHLFLALFCKPQLLKPNPKATWLCHSADFWFSYILFYFGSFTFHFFYLSVFMLFLMLVCLPLLNFLCILSLFFSSLLVISYCWSLQTSWGPKHKTHNNRQAENKNEQNKRKLLSKIQIQIISNKTDNKKAGPNLKWTKEKWKKQKKYKPVATNTALDVEMQCTETLS